MGIKYPEPKTPQVVYVQSPAPAPAPAPLSEPGKSEEEIAADLRRENLLSRNRSRFGTVLTGFRGFLSPDNGNTRKTLLGE